MSVCMLYSIARGRPHEYTTCTALMQSKPLCYYTLSKSKCNV
jgi:hypothetical protein